MALVMFEMSVPKILLIDEVRLAGFAMVTIGAPEEVIVALCGWWLALSPLSVARLNEFLLMTMTFEFSLFPFLRSYII